MKRFLFILGLLSAACAAQGVLITLPNGAVSTTTVIGSSTVSTPPPSPATVTVCTYQGSGMPCSPLATIYYDQAMTTPAPNPITTDALGNLPTRYIAAGATVILTVQGSGLTPTTWVQTIPGAGCTPSGTCTATNWVLVMPTITGKANVQGTLYGPAVSGTVNLVGAGDSRMALRGGLATGQDLLTQISLQPQFAAFSPNVYNGAVAGSKCSDMTSDYAANVQPYKPSGSIKTAYLFIEEGINDVTGGVNFSTFTACYQAYLNQALSDGFTPVLFTVYYDSGATDAEDTERQQINDWLRQQPFLIVDSDLTFLPTSDNPWYGTPTATADITGYSISSGTATFTASNSFSSTNQIYLSGFPSTSACLQNKFITVASATSSQFTAPVTCPNATSTDTGYAQTYQGDTEHLGPWGNILLAQVTNQDWGIAKSGINFPQPQARDYSNAPSGFFRAAGCLIAGPAASGMCNHYGHIYSYYGAEQGALFAGSNNDAYLARGENVPGGNGWLLQLGAEGGEFAIQGTTAGVQLEGGGLVACATAYWTSCPTDSHGYIWSAQGGNSGAVKLGGDGAVYWFRNASNASYFVDAAGMGFGTSAPCTLIDTTNCVVEIAAPNTNFGPALDVRADANGRNMRLVSQNYNVGTSTGTSMNFDVLSSYVAQSCFSSGSHAPCAFQPTGGDSLFGTSTDCGSIVCVNGNANVASTTMTTVATASLPTCGSSTVTQTMWVNDATSNTFGAAPAGSGTWTVPVGCTDHNGAYAWLIGG